MTNEIRIKELKINSILSKVTHKHIHEMSILLMNNHFLSCIYDLGLLEDVGKIQEKLTEMLNQINIFQSKMIMCVNKKLEEVLE